MKQIQLEPGEIVQVSDALYEIISLTPAGEIQVRNLKSGKIVNFPLSKIEAPKENKTTHDPPFDALTEKQKAVAKKRYAILKPLIQSSHGEKYSTAEKLAKEHSISIRSLYGWLKRFQQTGKVSAKVITLVDKRETRGSRRSRITKRQLSIIDRIAQDYYETPQKPNTQRTIEQVQMACQVEKISAPSARTIRRHIGARNTFYATGKREGHKVARDRYGAVYGKSHQDAQHPLDLVQMDHTQLDIELVDDKKRLPIGRPNITLAMDVFSRAILGFFVSFENSSLLTTGLCLEHAMFPKDEWLKRNKINHSWPVWGMPKCLHVDNALEFRSNGLKDFCDEYDVRLEYRPVKTPHYGGHVERLFGTIKEQVHTLPGTTFSNVKQKGEYPSEKKAVITIGAFQRWLGEYITGAYLQKIHSSLGMTPLEKWIQGIRGTSQKIGIGAPPILSDREKVTALLLPTYERSMQRDGIRLDHIQYFSSALHALFIEKVTKKEIRKVTIKRDPRDISTIKILDNDRKKWFTVPYRDISYPSISLWEWQAAQAEIRKSKKPSNEKILFETYRQMQEIVEQEKKETKKTRRSKQRNRDAGKEKKRDSSLSLVKSTPKPPSNLIPAEKVRVYKSKFFI